MLKTALTLHLHTREYHVRHYPESSVAVSPSRMPVGYQLHNQRASRLCLAAPGNKEETCHGKGRLHINTCT